MSDEYKINPQLADKKTQALAEIVNDIVIDTPASEIPNIKAVNQRQHGMCAAISICRKALAYEDKPNFVDMIMSELDENPYMMVYDISKLGTHTKIKTPKTYVDFDYAISRGYRIIDASALYWMHIADTEFSQNEVVGMYSAFDKEFFDTFHDSHLLPNFKDEDLSKKQDYYRSLIKAKNAITAYKIATLIKDYKNKTEKTNKNKKIDNIRQYNKRLDEILHQIAPDSDFKTRHQIITDLKHLEVKDYDATQKVDDYKKDFVYLPQESNDVKAEKIVCPTKPTTDDKDQYICKEEYDGTPPEERIEYVHNCKLVAKYVTCPIVHIKCPNCRKHFAKQLRVQTTILDGVIVGTNVEEMRHDY
jgi:hypothetical protein